jgi:hypothetical protein
MKYILTEAQQNFAAHYAEHGKQADAYRAAYGSEISSVKASERGRCLLRNQAVRDLVGELRGSPLPKMETARDPRVPKPTRRIAAPDESGAAPAITALAAVVGCAAIPPAHRLASIELLQGFLSNLAEELRGAAPLPCTDDVRELRTHKNGGSMVGNGAGRDNSAGANGRH